MLAEGEMDNHAHVVESLVWGNISNVADGYKLRKDRGVDDSATDGWILNSHLKNPQKSTFTGNNVPHNNLPPIYGVYKFRRVK